jgi:general secretion pathway protein C
LDLVLVGVLAARSDGLGQAIIQYRQDQSIYRVGDALPVSGRVSLAKVLADRVVLDNSGTYELLKLYDESALAKRLLSVAKPAAQQPMNTSGVKLQTGMNPPPDLEAAGEQRRARIDDRKRDRYYNNPESLSELVSVSAVRSADGQLAGYRVSPGPKGEEFQSLGFRPGDVVTEVNGLSLSDPSNALVLYQMLKSATEANFVIQRGGSQMNLAVQVGGDRP